MSEPIDWVELDKEIRSRNSQEIVQRFKVYSSSQAMVGLELIIGEDRLREAVDYYVAYKPESELARHVLWRLRPWSAMQRCYEIFRWNTDREDRRAAIGLLSVVGDERALDWIEEFLADSDDWIQQGAINILDQMLFGGGIRYNEPAMEKVDLLLASAEEHPNPNVRQGAASLRADEARRNRRKQRKKPRASSATAKKMRRKRDVLKGTAIERGR